MVGNPTGSRRRSGSPSGNRPRSLTRSPEVPLSTAYSTNGTPARIGGFVRRPPTTAVLPTTVMHLIRPPKIDPGLFGTSQRVLKVPVVMFGYFLAWSEYQIG